MEAILEAFGIDWRLIVIQIFNFAILAGLLWYFLYTPILNVLKERQSKIEKGVRDAEAAERARMDADEEKGVILSDAHSEADSIVTRAKEHAKETESSIVDEAHTKAERILEDAGAKGEEIKDRARKESESEIAKVAVLAAEKVLKQEA